MRHDLVLSGFGASVPEMVAAALAAERAGFDGVWVYDHFGGAMLGRPWARDPFVTLGAIGAQTERIGLGPLVANVANRHPAQLASAINTLQSIAPGRVTCGVGSGAEAGSRFAGEATAIGRAIDGADTRRRRLEETVGCLRAIWAGVAFDGAHYHVEAGPGIVDGAAPPPIVVGAAGATTVALAARIAEGVNIRESAQLPHLVDLARTSADGRGLEIGVFTQFDVAHPLGGDALRLAALGVDRRTLHMSAPFPVQAIAEIGARLAAERV